jgi:hypothetical protein
MCVDYHQEKEIGDFAPTVQSNGDFTPIFSTLRLCPSFSQMKAPLCNYVNR